MSLTPYVHLDEGVLREADAGTTVALSSPARTHLQRVLRLRPGAALVVADGQGRQATAELGTTDVVLTSGVEVFAAPATGIHLVQGLAKGRKTDDIVRSATELGVDRITIVASQRSVTKAAGGKQERLLDRWQAVAWAASEQSRRPWRPVVDGPTRLADLVVDGPGGEIGVIGHPAANRTLRAALGDIASTERRRVVVAVGPEGGWEDQEVEALAQWGLLPVSLGATILRTEHAGHALCSIVAYELDRLA